MQAKSSTCTQIQYNEKKNNQKEEKPQRTLILHLEQKPAPKVSWTEDTIDNEHMKKKKSNLCCIYHKPGESSSDTCTSDDQANALERDRNTKNQHKKICSKRKNKPSSNHQKYSCSKDSHKSLVEKKFADE